MKNFFKRNRNLSDTDLATGCQKGQADCQEALYRRFAPKMMGVCVRYFPDRAEAQDVLQDAFIRVFDKIHQYKGQGSLEGWVRRLIVSTAIDRLRKNKSIGCLHSVPLEDVDEPSVEADHLPDDADLLLHALQSLPDGYRAVFNLYAIEGFCHAEVAEMLGISVGTSKSQLSNARQFLKKWLQNHHPDLYARKQEYIGSAL
jgi:RNA polymerase sigma-70 factor (ECF subfamily)